LHKVIKCAGLSQEIALSATSLSQEIALPATSLSQEIALSATNSCSLHVAGKRRNTGKRRHTVVHLQLDLTAAQYF
jgi:hypothetical protein